MRTMIVIAALTLSACSTKESASVETTTDSATVTTDSVKVDTTTVSTDTTVAK